MTFVHTHRVRYHETDAQGFLFNSRYLELADVAMTEFFRALGWPYMELIVQGVDPSVVSASLSFVKPVHFDDVLEVEVSCSRVGRSSFDLELSVTRDGAQVASIAMVYVNVDATAKESQPLPAPIARALSTQRSSS